MSSRERKAEYWQRQIESLQKEIEALKQARIIQP